VCVWTLVAATVDHQQVWGAIANDIRGRWWSNYLRWENLMMTGMTTEVRLPVVHYTGWLAVTSALGVNAWSGMQPWLSCLPFNDRQLLAAVVHVHLVAGLARSNCTGLILTVRHDKNAQKTNRNWGNDPPPMAPKGARCKGPLWRWVISKTNPFGRVLELSILMLSHQLSSIEW